MLEEDIKDHQALLKLCADGDNDAWACLVKVFSPLIYRVIRQRAVLSFISLADSDIDEIFQQTFTNIWRKNSINRIANAKSIPAYLTVIAQNTSIDFFRKNISQHEIKEKFSADTLSSVCEKNPRDETHDREISRVIDNFIKSLTIKENRIITLELIHDLKHREIAHLMDMPVNTVSTIIARLKHALKEKLKEKGYDT